MHRQQPAVENPPARAEKIPRTRFPAITVRNEAPAPPLPIKTGTSRRDTQRGLDATRHRGVLLRSGDPRRPAVRHNAGAGLPPTKGPLRRQPGVGGSAHRPATRTRGQIIRWWETRWSGATKTTVGRAFRKEHEGTSGQRRTGAAYRSGQCPVTRPGQTPSGRYPMWRAASPGPVRGRRRRAVFSLHRRICGRALRSRPDRSGPSAHRRQGRSRPGSSPAPAKASLDPKCPFSGDPV